MACTGNTATLTDGTWVGSLTTIGGLSQSVPALDNSDLSTTQYMTKCRGDLIELGGIDCDINWDQDDPPPILNATGDWVLTFPIPEGKSAGAIVSGAGFITESSGATLANNEVQTGSFQLQFDGTDIAFTPSAP